MAGRVRKIVMLTALGLLVGLLGALAVFARQNAEPSGLTLPSEPISNLSFSVESKKFGLLFFRENRLVLIDPEQPKRRLLGDRPKRNDRNVLNAVTGPGGIAYVERGRRGAVWVADRHYKQNRPVAKVAKNWHVQQLAWSPDMKSLAVLMNTAYRPRGRDFMVRRTGPEEYRFVYETVLIDFENNRLQLLDRFVFDDSGNSAYISIINRSKGDFRLLRWTSSGLVSVVGQRVARLEPNGKKTVITLNEQPLGSGSISPDGKRMLYETINRAWVIDIEPSAKARLVKDRVFPVWPEEPPSNFTAAKAFWTRNDRALMLVYQADEDRTSVFEFTPRSGLKYSRRLKGSLGFSYKGAVEAQAAVDPSSKQVFADGILLDLTDFSQQPMPFDNRYDEFLGWIGID
jgi:dipeptidyl aminopeptidase/acylaminoacyl peptidase